MLSPDDIRRRIVAALPGADVEVKDLTGTGDHFEARVVEQHQLVYASLDEWLESGALHALALKTYSPEQWKRAQAR